jgi:hypothetical protein
LYSEGDRNKDYQAILQVYLQFLCGGLLLYLAAKEKEWSGEYLLLWLHLLA